MQRTQTRQLTSAKVKRTLAGAGIPALGPNKLPVLSRTGNSFAREDGTLVRIFNVQAFKNMDDAQAASASWKAGHALELSGDIEGAQEHYKDAYNKLMSFSVLEENATEFENLFEIACRIAEVPASAALQEQGITTVIGINNPKPVAVHANIASTSSLFEEEEEETDETEETPPPATSLAKKGNGKGNGKGNVAAAPTKGKKATVK